MVTPVIVNGFRTPIGQYNGTLSSVSAGRLLKYVIKENLKGSRVSGDNIDEVIAGNAGNNPLEYNVARISSLYAGLPQKVPAYTVNRLCGSGMQSILSAVESICKRRNQVVLAGGTENMSQYRYAVEKNKLNFKLGDKKIRDTLEEVLIDPLLNMRTTELAEFWAKEFNFSREEIDDFALQSFRRAGKARREGKFTAEVVRVKTENGEVREDEIKNEGVTREELNNLPPIVKGGEHISAGNSSKISDGAACVLVMSEKKARELAGGFSVKIRDIGVSACDPRFFGLAPVNAIEEVLRRNKLTVEEIDLIELNEAFAVQCLMVIKKLGIPGSKINVNGGAISLGHPLGCSGTRIVVTLIHEMKRRKVRYGLAALCIGGGQGMAILLENDL